MAGGLTVSVRQIGSYPTTQGAIPSDLVLTQRGLGGPYLAPTAYELISGALLSGGALGVGIAAPGNAAIDQLFSGNTVLPLDGARYWNAYNQANGAYTYLANGVAGADGFDGVVGFDWVIAPAGVAGQTFGGFETMMRLSPAGALNLNFGTLTVARDPASALEVATMGWVGANTVASFNNRRGVVTLSAADIYSALGICPPDCIATTSSVNAQICAAINDLLRTYPSVWSWMGRVGDVFLTVADMNFAAANNPSFQPPLTIPTPPETAVDGEVVTAAWVIAYLGQTAGFATEAWVTAYVAANAVTSFNGRLGTVTLTLADIQGAGGAPAASPIFSGVPTAPTAAANTATSQIATTAFVMAAVNAATAGVASFNGRTGTVVLNSTDIIDAGGAPIASPAFSGTPTAPTPLAGNSSTQIATTAFVQNALAAQGAVTSFNGRTGAVTFLLSDVTGVGGAPIASPALTGTPTAPTAAAGTNNTQVATTAFVNAAISAIGAGVTSFEGRTGAVTLQANDISAAGGLINPSVALTGVPTAPTASPGTSSTQIASTAFVTAAIIAGSVTTFNGRSGAVTLAAADLSGAGGALLASPAFSGTPTGPTAPPATSTTQLATTAFVTGALATQAANSVTSFNGRQGIVTLTTADVTGAGGAPIASPTFTGTPSVPTATAGTSTTQAASTAFVMAAIAASTAGVTSFNSRTGAVTLQANDVSAVGGALLASPVFTGTPSAPTPLAGDNSTNIATTAFVQNALATAAVTSFNTRTGAVTLTLGDVTGAGGAPIASPALTGTPTAPTASAGTNTTQLATTAFVHTALAGYVPLSGTTAATGPVTGQLSVGTGSSPPPATAPQGIYSAYDVVQFGTSGGAGYYLNGIPGTPSTYWQTGTAGVIQNVATGMLFQSFASGAAGAALTGTPGTMTLIQGVGTSPSGALVLGSVNARFNATPVYGNGSAPLIGETTGANYTQILYNGGTTSSGLACTFMRIDNVAVAYCNFFAGASTQIGSINTVSGSSVNYNTTSDDRLKVNQNPITDGGQLLDGLAPITFNWDADPAGTAPSHGFSAQATEAVYPEAVTPGMGNPGDAGFRPYGMDLSKLVPLLVAAVQALRARVAALESHAGVSPAVPVTQ